jgi:hypothetical protein
MSIMKATLRAALVAASLLPVSVRAADLAGEVAAKLRESGALQGYRINVKAKSGTVWLEGRVADEKQMAAAVGLVEASRGVERVVNRLTVESTPPATGTGFGLPASMRAFAGPSGRPAAAQQAASASGPKPMYNPFASKPKPLAAGPAGAVQQAAFNRSAMRGGMPGMPGMPEMLPGPNGMGPVGDGQIVPGSMRFSEGGPVGDGEMAGGMPGGYAGGYAGGGAVANGPMPMGGAGVGMPPIPMRGDGPNMPNYAWPSYAAYPNYAALQYPTQYSPTAWPYIGPFYPYPQVPLGWRRVSLEWDDGWWWLDFDERHIHSHHR